MTEPHSTLPPELLQIRQQRLTRAQAAEYLGIPEHTLANWVTTKRKRVPYLKVGRRVYYAVADLDRFLEECRRT
ncbi:helix-turn-helix domain-containing protein [Imhoffiella purpurea]|uniref:Helix-turn-helix domain-containing protein n=1 Tax=Imhoffiella purpurea TaxID=1249627 RepID=W9VEX3_9GAMM|nr:helix-turn-helix domain-containing protein [Imhoffiella purpurea]EXJ14592.1 hypothetical protein D779_2286 [Imhoffiella purpurea]